MSFIPVLEYGLGLGIFGFTYWLMNGIMDEFIAAGVHETGTIYSLLTYFWAGVLLIYLIFGGIWVVRKYNEAEYRQGGL